MTDARLPSRAALEDGQHIVVVTGERVCTSPSGARTPGARMRYHGPIADESRRADYADT